MFKKIFCLAFVFSFFLSLSAQSSIRLGVLKGISCAPCAYLIENKEKLAVQNMEFQIFDSEQAELPKLLRGELDMGFLTAEDAAKVFTAGNGVLLVAGVVQNGNAVLLTSEEGYKNLGDLRGKKILCGERFSNEAFVFKSILAKKSVISDSVENADSSIYFDFSVPTANIANKLIRGEENFALLPEPFASVALKNASALRRAESLQKLYAETITGTYPAMVLVVRSDFATKNRDLVRKFIEVYKNALLWTTKNPAKVSLLIEKHKFGISQAIARDSIPNANLLWRNASLAKNDVEKYLTLLNREFPNEFPSDEFYFLP